MSNDQENEHQLLKQLLLKKKNAVQSPQKIEPKSEIAVQQIKPKLQKEQLSNQAQKSSKKPQVSTSSRKQKFSQRKRSNNSQLKHQHKEALVKPKQEIKQQPTFQEVRLMKQKARENHMNKKKAKAQLIEKNQEQVPKLDQYQLLKGFLPNTAQIQQEKSQVKVVALIDLLSAAKSEQQVKQVKPRTQNKSAPIQTQHYGISTRQHNRGRKKQEPRRAPAQLPVPQQKSNQTKIVTLQIPDKPQAVPTIQPKQPFSLQLPESRKAVKQQRNSQQAESGQIKRTTSKVNSVKQGVQSQPNQSESKLTYTKGDLKVKIPEKFKKNKQQALQSKAKASIDNALNLLAQTKVQERKPKVATQSVEFALQILQKQKKFFQGIKSAVSVSDVHIEGRMIAQQFCEQEQPECTDSSPKQYRLCRLRKMAKDLRKILSLLEIKVAQK